MTGLIPFNKPHIPVETSLRVAEILKSGHLSGDGPVSKDCQRKLRDLTGGANHFLTPSCSHALEIAIRALNVGPGDEVILPSFNFTSAANAIVLAGAIPVFVDVDPLTFVLDPNKVEAAITSRTKCVLTVHYAGIGTGVELLSKICAENGLALIEDNAHGLGGKWAGKFLGTFGQFSTQSFHETKNIQSGEGGSISFSDPQYSETIEILREKGTNRANFFRGQVDKYTWVAPGSSWIQSEILAAVLDVQLENFSAIQEKRHRIWAQYKDSLEKWADKNGYRLPHVPTQSEHTAHLFYLVAPSNKARDDLIKHHRSRDVISTFHYQALHSSRAGKKLGRHIGDMSNTDIASSQLLRLPLWPDLNDEQIARVLAATLSF